MSIRYQILVPLVLVIFGLVGICAWTAQDSARLARRRIAEQVHGVIRTLNQDRFPLTQAVLEQTKGLSRAEYLLIEPNGKRVATLPSDGVNLPAAEAPTKALADDSLGTLIQLDDHGYFCRGIALREPRQYNAGCTLYVLYPESLVNDALWQAVRPSLVLGASGGLAALILALVAGQRLVGRVRKLERRTRQIAAGDFSPMPLPRNRDELRDLAQSVNEMAQRLAQFRDAVTRAERVRLLGQVSGGLAHQLRNAVTGAKLAVQLHADSCAGGDGEALQVADRQLARMATDLQRFFDIGRTGGKREPCALGELIDNAVALLRPQCKHARIALEWTPPTTEVHVLGDAGQLGHLLLNVLGNAVDAVGTDGRVEIRLSADKNAAIEVIDSGPGPEQGISARIFEPFVTGKSEGIGLGLAVAKQVAEAHGGTIAWRRENERTCFRIELPL